MQAEQNGDAAVPERASPTTHIPRSRSPRSRSPRSRRRLAPVLLGALAFAVASAIPALAVRPSYSLRRSLRDRLYTPFETLHQAGVHTKAALGTTGPNWAWLHWPSWLSDALAVAGGWAVVIPLPLLLGILIRSRFSKPSPALRRPRLITRLVLMTLVFVALEQPLADFIFRHNYDLTAWIAERAGIRYDMRATRRPSGWEAGYVGRLGKILNLLLTNGTLTYTAMVAGCIAHTSDPIFVSLRSKRLNQGDCPACGYTRSGLDGRACPECGSTRAPVDKQTAEPRTTGVS